MILFVCFIVRLLVIRFSDYVVHLDRVMKLLVVLLYCHDNSLVSRISMGFLWLSVIDFIAFFDLDLIDTLSRCFAAL